MKKKQKKQKKKLPIDETTAKPSFGPVSIDADLFPAVSHV